MPVTGAVAGGNHTGFALPCIFHVSYFHKWVNYLIIYCPFLTNTFAKLNLTIKLIFLI